MSPSVYCTPQPCSSSDVGVASSTQMWRLPLAGEGEPHTRALTRAGALLPLSLVLASATGLVAQVLEVHLHLLAVLFHRWSTCLATDRGCYRGSKFPTYTLILSSMHPGLWGGPEWDQSGRDVSLDWGGRRNTCSRQQDLSPPGELVPHWWSYLQITWASLGPDMFKSDIAYYQLYKPQGN